MTKLTSATLAVAAAAMACVSSYGQAIGYNNSATAQVSPAGSDNILRIDGNPGNVNLELGDEINLLGGANTVTSFQFEYFYSGGPGATAVVRFYDLTPVAGGGFTVGSVIAGSQSTAFTLEAGHQKGTSATISVAVPGRFVWAIEFQNVGPGATVGPDLYTDSFGVGNGPGQSADNHWARTPGGSWNLFESALGIDNFGLQIMVVPEPGTVALFAVGGLALVAAARRRKS